MCIIASQITSNLTVSLTACEAKTKRNIQAPYYWYFSRWTHDWMVGYPRKWVMRKAIPCHEGLMHCTHDDVIKWKHFPRNWPFVRGIHRSPVNSPRKGQWRRALMFSLIGIWINDWVNNREAGDLRCYRAHYDVSVMFHFQQTLTMTHSNHLWL